MLPRRGDTRGEMHRLTEVEQMDGMGEIHLVRNSYKQRQGGTQGQVLKGSSSRSRTVVKGAWLWERAWSWGGASLWGCGYSRGVVLMSRQGCMKGCKERMRASEAKSRWSMKYIHNGIYGIDKCLAKEVKPL